VGHQNREETEMSLGERLKQVRGTVTQKEFSSTMGVSKNTLALYERDRRVPDAKFLESLCRKFHVNSEWLLLGEGEPHRPKIKLPTGPDLLARVKEGTPTDPIGLILHRFMVRKTPSSLRDLVNDRRQEIEDILLTALCKLNIQELIILQASIQAWVDDWQEDDAEEGPKHT
jgi:transcriptional regulator with XRE-family HTH domain